MWWWFKQKTLLNVLYHHITFFSFDFNYFKGKKVDSNWQKTRWVICILNIYIPILLCFVFFLYNFLVSHVCYYCKHPAKLHNLKVEREFIYTETYAGNPYSMITLSLENSYYIFCDQREEIYREWALFLKCPQTWGQVFYLWKTTLGSLFTENRWRLSWGREGIMGRKKIEM